MSRSRRASASSASARPGVVRVVLVLAALTLVVGLAAQVYGWANPAPQPTQGLVSPDGPTLASIARALATVLLWMVLPLQLLALAVIVAIRPFVRRSQPSQR